MAEPLKVVPFNTVESALSDAYGTNSPLISEVEKRLDARLLEYVRAKFKREYHFTHLRMWVMAGLPTGIYKGRGVEKMILDCLGHKIGLRSLQRDLRCTTMAPLTLIQVLNYLQITKSRLAALHKEAMKRVGPVLGR